MPDFGETAIGGSEQFIGTNYLFGTKFTLGTGMTINSITFRIKTYGGTPFNVRGAIYSDVAGTPTDPLTTATASVSVNAANTWFTSNVTPYVAATGTYWICVFAETAASASSYAVRAPGDVANQSANNDGATFPTFPTPFGANYLDQVYSFYATGTVAAAGNLVLWLEEPTLGQSAF